MHAGRETGWVGLLTMLQVENHISSQHKFSCWTDIWKIFQIFQARLQGRLTEFLARLFPIGRFLMGIHSGSLPKPLFKYCEPPTPGDPIEVYMNTAQESPSCAYTDRNGKYHPPVGLRMTQRQIAGPDLERRHRYQLEVPLPSLNWKKVLKFMKLGEFFLTTCQLHA